MLEIIEWLFVKVNTYPKAQRFILGQQTENSAIACLQLIIEANEARSPSAALEKLDALNIKLEVLRDLLRVGNDFGFMTTKSLFYIVNQIDEVGKMRGGWAKHYISSSSNNCS